ncbi:tRNA U34 5-methylaminomethyl-2-thiouridine-forming methyltransferase MnmC [Dysgonomonas sp. PFB1-18]|uniref:tRNA (5-methylaminomethyl-2-thiouridine)(34)-methyltransferase MnmD n=1 Tax=unclassified Dysgonomonas TaxID=2630389 RepID=UPI00247518AF|nr:MULTISPECIES: tRNA (5-methylaminomethyl-2-thiouridine)(34)-methyltransferase MnmD [unclassified Dysgonomonas]MDH6309124.1 tRNA U34 5-methylaminomethyl-2-thiouridine-forming methyltransferase MnmC [Dysgonomonas sp. PF1-14]MDH6338996.1 tRNA U34 5-methylaminomethyl-2-thiouridine-forming methyltransferase MnmC [Dysgonomonas sp. PF1-16]MDH6380373.1 tRNA U34 5-methylaminomethyl-2-thiouridine-forming methyltransferase MnmC [Dysgonomonas sp. PFB1-18]MDH6397824.1 tRNA U34 5-methylaminomethyl-2-thiour
MSVSPEIILTADGSHTLFVPELDEHYHSVNGAIQESTHIFINIGLHQVQKETIRIFEVGFGTGLNAFLTLTDEYTKEKTIHYTAIEAYPLPLEIITKLNYAEQYPTSGQLLFQGLHKAEWDKVVKITPYFRLKKLTGDLTSFDYNLIEESVDIIYFDAFAPDKQPDMWTQDIFDRMYAITAPQGVLVTYCAKGSVRRMMQQAGYKVERLPGPPGKREMLRATK